MNNIKYLGKVLLTVLGIVWLGCTFSGCSHDITFDIAILILVCVNTLLLFIILGILIFKPFDK